MTDKHSPTSASGLPQSLQDAVPVRTLVSGRTGGSERMRTSLKNTRTGEHFYSICSTHWDYNADCDMCHKGGWAHPVNEIVLGDPMTAEEVRDRLGKIRREVDNS